MSEAALELTYQCNLDCFYCYNDREKSGIPLSLEKYRELLHDLRDMETMFLMLTGGEPMVHPHFFEIGSMAKELGFVTRLRTNGHSLTPAIAARVRDEVDPYLIEVSLHGATPQVHDRQTRVAGSFDRLIKNIRTVKALGLRISAVTTPTLWNEHQIDALFEQAAELDIPLRFQGPVGPRDNGDTEPLQIQPSPDVWARILSRGERESASILATSAAVNGSASTLSELAPTAPVATCGVGKYGVDIDPFGNVQACMHLQEAAGNLHDHSIAHIWENSPLFHRARTRAEQAAQAFVTEPPSQLGAPVYCLAIEENLHKGGCGSCGSGCHSGQ